MRAIGLAVVLTLGLTLPPLAVEGQPTRTIGFFGPPPSVGGLVRQQFLLDLERWTM
jgi:hypothetical protein